MDFSIVDLMRLVACYHPGHLLCLGHHLGYPIGGWAHPAVADKHGNLVPAPGEFRSRYWPVRPVPPASQM
jgi:hypothetical protein